MYDNSVAVRGLGVLCHLVRRGNDSLSINLEEFAELSDGNVITIRNERGYSSGWRGGAMPQRFARDSVVFSAGMALLPDEAEDEFQMTDGDYTGERIPWSSLAELLAHRGIHTTPEALKALPYVFEFTPELEALID